MRFFFFLNHRKKTKFIPLAPIAVEILLCRCSAQKITSLYFYFHRSSVNFVCNGKRDDINKKATRAIANGRSKSFCSKNSTIPFNRRRNKIIRKRTIKYGSLSYDTIVTKKAKIIQYWQAKFWHVKTICFC